jgi:hypothetical protein
MNIDSDLIEMLETEAAWGSDSNDLEFGPAESEPSLIGSELIEMLDE